MLVSFFSFIKANCNPPWHNYLINMPSYCKIFNLNSMTGINKNQLLSLSFGQPTILLVWSHFELAQSSVNVFKHACPLGKPRLSDTVFVVPGMTVSFGLNPQCFRHQNDPTVFSVQDECDQSIEELGLLSVQLKWIYQSLPDMCVSWDDFMELPYISFIHSYEDNEVNKLPLSDVRPRARTLLTWEQVWLKHETWRIL